MMKIEATIQTFQLEEVETILEKLGVEGITISGVLDHGGPAVRKAFHRGAEYRFDIPRLKLEMLVPAEWADGVSEAIAKLASAPFSHDDRTVLVDVWERRSASGAGVRYYDRDETTCGTTGKRDCGRGFAVARF